MASSSEQDSLASRMETWSLSEDPQAALEAQLADFPHTFQMQKNLREIRAAKLEQVQSGLESALAVGYTTRVETARARNLLAYILCRLNQPGDALKELDRVLDLEDQTNNMVTLANKAVILCREFEFSKAHDQLTRLRQIQTGDSDFEYLLVKGKAEIAFSYTRFGPSFSRCATDLFKEVILQAKPSELWLWNFGLGLTRRRALRSNPRGVSTVPPKDITDEQEAILDIFLKIVANCSCSNMKAKTYAEIATILFDVSKTPLRNKFFDMAGMSTTKACNKALELDSNDKSVLCKCGVILRRCKQAERARDLLEKCLKLRVSTRAHHHLGLTYKYLATDEKLKDQVKIPGYYQQLAEQQSQSGACQSIDDITWRFQKLSSSGSEHRHFDADIPTGIARITRGPPLSLNRSTRAMQKKIKSPPGNVTQFSRDDKYVKEALHHLEKAVEVSKGGNVRAIYDLALLQRTLGEYVSAMNTLTDMMNQPNRNKFPFDHVNVYEQMGQILMELAEREMDEKKKKDLLQDSQSMLLTALKKAYQTLKSAEVAEHPGEVFNSLAILCKRTENTDDVATEIEEKVKLLKLIKKYKPILGMLQELEKLDPQKAKDPTHQALMIESQVNLGEFVAAALLVEDLSDTTQVTEMFGEVQYVLKIYLKAARQTLLRGLPASYYFGSAFHEFVLANPEEISSSEFEDSDASGRSRDPWDVVIVYEDSARSKAQTLVKLLNTTCGLRVPELEGSTHPGKWELEELDTVRNSRLVVILAGREPSDRTSYFINSVAKRHTTVTLLAEGDQVPSLLQARRSLPCDGSLFQRLESAADGKMEEPEVEAVFEILNFLFNVRETLEP